MKADQLSKQMELYQRELSQKMNIKKLECITSVAEVGGIKSGLDAVGCLCIV